MRKILLILDGIVAKIFLEEILQKYFNDNIYIVVCNDPSFIPDSIPSTFTFHNFDPTSSLKLNKILSSDIVSAFIISDDAEQRESIYATVRAYNENMRIVISDKSEYIFNGLYKDKNLVEIDINKSVVNRLIEKVPNVPVIARGFGLEQGEIMAIGIPFGSAFAYRHVGSIQQKEWRLVGIYRGSEFIISSFSLTIQPNDTILCIGEPKILSDIYRQIKGDIGQFPAPLGMDIYLYLDLTLTGRREMQGALKDAFWLNKRLKNRKLNIVILNPRNMDFIKRMKALDSQNINIDIEYHESSFRKRLQRDSAKKMGLVMINRDLFSSRKNRAALYKINVPVLKVGNKRVANCKRGLVVLSEAIYENENISSVVFDISKQLETSIKIYDFDPDSIFKRDVTEHYENLSRIFNKSIEVIETSSKNPIIYMNEEGEGFIQFLPFEEGITKTRLLNFLSVSVERLSFMLKENPQIFIPIPRD